MKQSLLETFLTKYKVFLELRYTFESQGFPKGVLILRRVKHFDKEGSAQYYSYLRHQYRDNGKTFQIHIPKSKASEYTRLFQKRDSLWSKVKVLEQEVLALSKQLRKYYRRLDIENYRVEVYKEWDRQRRMKDLCDNEFSCQTLDGTIVRSKNECIFANVLYKLGIPFEYEKKLYLKTEYGYSYFRPDFTVQYNGSDLYIELFGQMDDADYYIDAMHKIDIYEKNGIVNGKNFLAFCCKDSRSINSITIERAMEQIKAGIMPEEIPALG